MFFRERYCPADNTATISVRTKLSPKNSNGSPDSLARYLFELKDGKGVFRFERTSPVERDDITLMLDQIIDEEFDNDIVPRKLAYLFPGSTFEPWHRSLGLAAVHSTAGPVRFEWSAIASPPKK